MTTVRDEKDGRGNAKVKCAECGHRLHRVDVHVVQAHKMSAEQYQKKHPKAPLMSEYARQRLDEAKARPKKVVRVKKDAMVLRLGAGRLRVRDDVDETDTHLVPPHDEGYQPGVHEMEQWEAMALAIDNREHVLIVGPTGCGKTSAARELASAANQPVQKINLHGDVRASDFVGEKVIDVDEESGQAVVFWRDGVLTSAMRRGHWLILDELDAAPPQILFVLQSVLEVGGYLTLAANHGEVVVPHENFRIIATANTLGRGDESGLYSGTNVLNEAFLDRFGVVIEARYPDAETEALILVKRAQVKPESARKMVECATKVREAYEKEDCYCTFSTRRLIAWATKAKRLGRSFDAARLTVLNRLSGEDRKFVYGVVERIFPPALTTPEAT